jgi:nicotinamidase-related amidase
VFSFIDDRPIQRFRWLKGCVVVLDVSAKLDPRQCAVVNMECQENLLGPDSVLPGLARTAADIGLLDTLVELFDAARSVGVTIYYCTDERRADGFGRGPNPITDRKGVFQGSGIGGHGPVMAPIAPKPADVVFRREQGVTGFFATGLDPYLRNTGVSTVVLTGVSLNIAVLGTAIEAMNHGYTVIVPSDAVASDPPEYADYALRCTVRNVGYVVPSQNIIDVWNALRD